MSHESVRFADDLAKQMFTEYVRTFVFNVQIDLVNESDINLCKQMNYCEFKSKEFEDYRKKLDELLAEKQIVA